MGGSTGGAIPGQPILPSIHETDMSIQADPRVMRMTVGAIPNSSTAHMQVSAVLLVWVLGITSIGDFSLGLVHLE